MHSILNNLIQSNGYYIMNTDVQQGDIDYSFSKMCICRPEMHGKGEEITYFAVELEYS